MVSKDKNDIKKFTDIVKTKSVDQMRSFINNNQNVHDYVYGHMKSYKLKGLKSINGSCLVLGFGGIIPNFGKGYVNVPFGQIIDIYDNTKTIKGAGIVRVHGKNIENELSKYSYGIMADQIYDGLKKIAKPHHLEPPKNGGHSYGSSATSYDGKVFDCSSIILIKKLEFNINADFEPNSAIIVLPLYGEDTIKVEYYVKPQ